MRAFWTDPYLWVHLAGAAAVPIFLELCLLGLAVGEPLLPSWLEIALVGAAGAAPILWMQWQRPFCIFSLLLLSLQPERLTDEQRKILRLFKAPIARILDGAGAVVLLAVLWQLYQIAPIASEVTPFDRAGHLGGLLIAAVAFLGANLFFQVPVSVLQVMLHSQSAFAAAEPYPIAQIAADFTLLGIPVKQILPPIKAAPAQAVPPPVPEPEVESGVESEAEPEPEAVAEAVAESTDAAISEPISESAAESTLESIPEPSAEPAAEPTVEAEAPTVVESTPIEPLPQASVIQSDYELAALDALENAEDWGDDDELETIEILPEPVPPADAMAEATEIVAEEVVEVREDVADLREKLAELEADAEALAAAAAEQAIPEDLDAAEVEATPQPNEPLSEAAAILAEEIAAVKADLDELESKVEDLQVETEAIATEAAESAEKAESPSLDEGMVEAIDVEVVALNVPDQVSADAVDVAAANPVPEAFPEAEPPEDEFD